VKAFVGWLVWLWRTRNCVHPQVRGIYGDERGTYDYRWRCVPCGKPLKMKPETAEVR
jgi:hypothetical protein